MRFTKSNILIILPAFNEGSVIQDVLLDIRAAGYEQICVVDDGSSDNTSNIARDFGAYLIIHPINRGPGAAVQTGITYAKKHGFEYAVLMDSDGQHLSEDIERLTNEMERTNADIVIGNRFLLKANNVPIIRITYNRLANIFTNCFCKNNYQDTQSGFRLLNRRAIECLQLKNKGFGFCSEMIIASEKANLLITETPIQVLYTAYSMGKGQNLMEGIRTARNILWRIVFG